MQEIIEQLMNLPEVSENYWQHEEKKRSKKGLFKKGDKEKGAFAEALLMGTKDKELGQLGGHQWDIDDDKKIALEHRALQFLHPGSDDFGFVSLSEFGAYCMRRVREAKRIHDMTKPKGKQVPLSQPASQPAQEPQSENINEEEEFDENLVEELFDFNKAVNINTSPKNQYRIKVRPNRKAPIGWKFKKNFNINSFSPSETTLENEESENIVETENTDSKCYITTACVESRNLPDDCEELTTLRQFRDQYMLRLTDGQELIKLYYEHAPVIVSRIKSLPNSKQVLTELYNVILECVDAIKNGKPEVALTIYKEMVIKLQKKYGQLLPHSGTCIK